MSEACCYNCQRKMNEDNFNTVFSLEEGDEVEICDYCMNEVWDCDNCDESFLGSWNITMSGEHICNSCREAHYVTCTGCGGLVSEDDYLVDAWGEIFCEDCYVDPESESDTTSQAIWDYGYKPSPRFHGSGEKFIGFELEVSTVHHEHGPLDLPSIAGELQEEMIVDGSPLVYCKEDCSLMYGFEIVSHPMTYEWMKDNADVFEPLWKIPWETELRSGNTHCCGFHVHVSRKALPPNTLYPMLRFLFNHKNNVQTIAQRRNNTWAVWETARDSIMDDLDDVLREKAYRKCWGGRTAINTSNSDTIEFRIFKGTLREDRFWKNIEFVDAVTSFAAEGYGVSESFEDFKSYIDCYDYPHLSAYIEERGL